MIEPINAKIPLIIHFPIPVDEFQYMNQDASMDTKMNTVTISPSISSAARNKKGKPMSEKLAAELLLAAKNEGDAIKKKDEMHRMAESNKAFAHFAW
jgi:hypothetical protein